MRFIKNNKKSTANLKKDDKRVFHEFAWLPKTFVSRDTGESITIWLQSYDVIREYKPGLLKPRRWLDNWSFGRLIPSNNAFEIN